MSKYLPKRDIFLKKNFHWHTHTKILSKAKKMSLNYFVQYLFSETASKYYRFSSHRIFNFQTPQHNLWPLFRSTEWQNYTKQLND